MSGQLDQEVTQGTEPSREDVLKEFGEAFSGGKRERDLETAKKPDDAPGPDKPSQGASAPGDAGKPGKSESQSAGTGNRSRDETGKFAPAPEPFEGFNDLKPEQQKFYKNLLAEKSKYQNDYAAVAGKLPIVQRELHNLQQRLAQPQTPVQSQKKVDDFLTSTKFKDYESRYPEDAAGIREALGQTVDQLRNELANSGKPLADDLNQVKSELEQIKKEREFQAAQREADRLSEDHPDWQIIAGWKDDAGNPVPSHAQQWHPWFSAWKAGLHPRIQQTYDQLLAEASADSIGHVLTHFKRDVQAHLDASGQQQSDAPESHVSQRRSEALQDISPRPSRGGADTPAPNFRSNGSDRDAVIAQFYDKWRSGQKP